MKKLWIYFKCVQSIEKEYSKPERSAERELKNLSKYQSWPCERGGNADHPDRLTRHIQRGEEERRSKWKVEEVKWRRNIKKNNNKNLFCYFVGGLTEPETCQSLLSGQYSNGDSTPAANVSLTKNLR